MAFIPIDAKADVQGTKKGKMTPEQHAQLNAWCLSNKTGILDWGYRCRAEETNITNIIGNSTIVRFKKGYIVICGRLVECEEGTEVTVNTPASGTETGNIVARYNLLANGLEEFSVIATSEALVQNDLNDNVLGRYDFVLYSYTATPSTLTLTREDNYISSVEDMFTQVEANLVNVEERLTALGFRQGSVALSVGTATTNTITRQGNYVVGNIIINDLTTTLNSEEGSFVFGVLPEGFRPKSQVTVGVTHLGTKVGNSTYVVIIPATHAVISTDGTITVYYNGKKYSGTSGITRLSFTGLQSFGFEAPPIN